MLFGVHLHQPVDNFDEVIEEAVNKCYGPFFEILSKYPEFKFAFHSSGWILEKLKNNYSDVFNNIKKCNIEFFTGGFYEPILVSIPREDRIVQIKKLNNFLKENFNAKINGIWITERVWDDEIIPELVECGLKYGIVDDYHFLASGYKEINGYYLTGLFEKIALFPISKELRYAIPFKEVDEAIKLLDRNLVMFDDIEKFGLWPGTNEWVYKKGWLKEFIEKTVEKSEHFSEFYEKNPSISTAFIENLSYEEMTEWCLDAVDLVKLKEDKKRCKSVFVKGSIWKRFFYKYPESFYIHQRMLRCTKNESYYKLQTNDVFWHGIFGGIYLPNLRDNAYRYLAECDNLKNEEFEGFEKKVFKDIIYVFKDDKLVEVLDLDKKFNYLNVVSRKKEFYHIYKEKSDKKGVKTIHDMDLNLDKEIYFDDYIRHSFIVRKADEVSFESLIKNDYKYKELNYYVKWGENKIICESNESDKNKSENKKSLKTIELNNKNIKFEINGEKIITEFNFHFFNYENIKEGEFEGEEIILEDGIHKIKLKFNYSKYFIYFIKTYSLSEKGFNEIIQGVCLVIKQDNLKGEISFE